MPVSKLIFFPKDTLQLCDSNKIFKALSDLKLIETIAHSKNHYLPGDNFLSLLTFLGCSPNINLTPTPEQAHCFVSLVSPTENPECLGYTSTCNPKCSNCKKRIASWKTDKWQQTGAVYTRDSTRSILRAWQLTRNC